MDLNKLNVKQLKELVKENKLFKNYSKLKKDALIAGIKASDWYKDKDIKPDAFMQALHAQIKGSDWYKQQQAEEKEAEDKKIENKFMHTSKINDIYRKI